MSVFLNVWAIGDRAAAIDLELAVTEADRVEVPQEHLNRFDVDLGRDRADTLNPDLVKLPFAAGRRPLATEHRANVEHPLLIALCDPGVDQGAHDAGRTFGAQRQAAAAAIFEGVHLLLHDVRLPADALFKNCSALH